MEFRKLFVFQHSFRFEGRVQLTEVTELSLLEANQHKLVIYRLYTKDPIIACDVHEILLFFYPADTVIYAGVPRNSHG